MRFHHSFHDRQPNPIPGITGVEFLENLKEALCGLRIEAVSIVLNNKGHGAKLFMSADFNSWRWFGATEFNRISKEFPEDLAQLDDIGVNFRKFILLDDNLSVQSQLEVFDDLF